MWFYDQKEVSLHFDNCFLCAQQKKGLLIKDNFIE